MITARRFARDRRRAVRWWLLGVAALVLSSTALFPTVEGNESFEQLAEDLPTAVSAAFGIDASVGLTSAPGYLHSRLFSTLLPVVLLIFAIGLGTRAVAGAEEDGTLELTLAQPITRRRLLSERFAAVAAMTAVLTAAALVVLLGSAAAFGALEDVSIAGLLTACVAAGGLALLHGAIAFAAGAETGRRGVALGAATTIAVAGYLLHGLLGVTDAVRPLRFLTPWHWYLGQNMLAHGPSAAAVALPLAAAAVLFAVGVARFERRDLR